jgi:hypothetical protein
MVRIKNKFNIIRIKDKKTFANFDQIHMFWISKVEKLLLSHNKPKFNKNAYRLIYWYFKDWVEWFKIHEKR